MCFYVKGNTYLICLWLQKRRKLPTPAALKRFLNSGSQRKEDGIPGENLATAGGVDLKNCVVLGIEPATWKWEVCVLTVTLLESSIHSLNIIYLFISYFSGKKFSKKLYSSIYEKQNRGLKVCSSQAL